MNLRIIVIPLVISIMLLTGCAASKKDLSVTPPPTPDQAASLKAAIQQINPQAQVGTISAVITESPLAMIERINPDGVKPGDVFSIVGASNTVVANAVVEKIIDGKIAVRYEPIVRPPLMGDLAVKF